jgi:hypothetical protein
MLLQKYKQYLPLLPDFGAGTSGLKIEQISKPFLFIRQNNSFSNHFNHMPDDGLPFRICGGICTFGTLCVEKIDNL